jgi:hypothetical protein
MITWEIYARDQPETVDVRANDYGKDTLDAEEGTHSIAPTGVMGQKRREGTDCQGEFRRVQIVFPTSVVPCEVWGTQCAK